MRGTTPPGVSFAPGQIHYALRDLVRARRIFNRVSLGAVSVFRKERWDNPVWRCRDHRSHAFVMSGEDRDQIQLREHEYELAASPPAFDAVPGLFTHFEILTPPEIPIVGLAPALHKRARGPIHKWRRYELLSLPLSLGEYEQAPLEHIA